MLKADESVFKNPVALDFDFMPKLVPYREGEQQHMASCIKPLFSERNGRNMLIHGPPGVGKTVACRHVLKELEEKSEDIVPLYINCWQKNTSFKVALEVCEQLGYRLTHNKNTDELLEVAIDILNRGSAVLVFDEVDKLEDEDFLYVFLERLYRKCVFLITNFEEWAASLDTRLKSRLSLDVLHFRRYSSDETRGILKQRVELAFYKDVVDKEAFERVVEETSKQGDIRVGLHILREAGNAAEEKASRRIIPGHVNTALERLHSFSPKSSADLEEAASEILTLVKGNPDTRIGTLFKIYQEQGGSLGYKSFQRKMKKLEQGGFISVKRSKGTGGNTSIISHTGHTKTLDQY